MFVASKKGTASTLKKLPFVMGQLECLFFRIMDIYPAINLVSALPLFCVECRLKTIITPVMEWIMSPQNRYVQVLNPRDSECDLIWK